MKTLRVHLPDALVAQIESESRARKLSISDIVRERLSGSPVAVADLVGSVDGLPTDLSSVTKKNLEATGYGRKRPR